MKNITLYILWILLPVFIIVYNFFVNNYSYLRNFHLFYLIFFLILTVTRGNKHNTSSNTTYYILNSSVLKYHTVNTCSWSHLITKIYEGQHSNSYFWSEHIRRNCMFSLTTDKEKIALFKNRIHLEDCLAVDIIQYYLFQFFL